MTVRIIALAKGRNPAIALQGHMDNLAFMGIHGLQSYTLTSAFYLVSQTICQAGQGLNAAVTIVLQLTRAALRRWYTWNCSPQCTRFTSLSSL